MPYYRFNFRGEYNAHVDVEADSQSHAEEMLDDGEVEIPELCAHCSGFNGGSSAIELGEPEFMGVDDLEGK